MSPTTKKRNPVIHRAQLILAVRALGMLAATVSHRPGPFLAIPATSFARNWPRPVLAGYRQPAGRRAALPRWAHHVIMVPGPLPGGCVTMDWRRQARPGRHRVLIDSPATRTTSSPHPSQRLQKHMARGTVGWPIVSSPSLGLSSGQLVSVRGRQLRVVALSGS
jgi:hypothetical protein